MNSIGCDKVLVITELPILSILNLEIRIKENEHGSLRIKAVGNKEYKDDLENNLHKDKLSIVVLEKDSNIVLFSGKIEELEISQVKDYCEIYLVAYTNTIRMDREERKISYQDVELTYDQILEIVATRNSKAKYMQNVDRFRQIKFPIIQYEETDWDFVKRLASHFQTVVYPDMSNKEPAIQFGVRKGRQQNWEGMKILRYGYGRSYYTSGIHEKRKSKRIAKYMECQSDRFYRIGDFFYYQGCVYIIFQLGHKLVNGAISNTYILGINGMIQKIKYFNQAISGAQLRGTVKGRVGENVLMHLDIDSREQKLFKWPFMPITGNLSYCMPEIGAKAILYFPTSDEADGVVSCIVYESNANDNMDSQNREFKTVYNKKICMYPQCMVFSGQVGQLLLLDSMGIEIKSKVGINLCADKGISINGTKVFLQSPLEIACKTHKSNIDICRDFNFYAPSGVTTQGINNIITENKMISVYEAETIEYWKAAFSAVASIPMMDLRRGDQDSIIDLKACGCVALFAKGSTTFAMKEVMEGKKERDTSFPNVFRTMESYTVKGGYFLPEIDE